MGVNLQKGQKVDLTKGNAHLKSIMVGLGWDEAGAGEPAQKKGFLSSVFGKPQPKVEIDCDASAILCSTGGKLTRLEDVVYFGNLEHETHCVKHMGDNLTGAGEGDDEQIFVRLSDIPGQFEKIVFVVNIYQAQERNQHFGMIRNAFIRIVDADTNTELCKFNLTENYSGMTALVVGEVYRHNGEWKFNAVGQATTDNGLAGVIARYR